MRRALYLFGYAHSIVLFTSSHKEVPKKLVEDFGTDLKLWQELYGLEPSLT